MRDLIHGVFDAIVDSSIQQMEAYAELVAAVAQSVDRFLEENVSDDDARTWLDRTLPGIDGAGEATAALALDAARRRLAKQRQQLLATMVLMGVNRAPSTARLESSTTGSPGDAFERGGKVRPLRRPILVEGVEQVHPGLLLFLRVAVLDPARRRAEARALRPDGDTCARRRG